MPLPLSVLDFASVRTGKTVGEAFQESVELAQAAERLGYERVGLIPDYWGPGDGKLTFRRAL